MLVIVFNNSYLSNWEFKYKTNCVFLPRQKLFRQLFDKHPEEIFKLVQTHKLLSCKGKLPVLCAYIATVSVTVALLGQTKV